MSFQAKFAIYAEKRIFWILNKFLFNLIFKSEFIKTNLIKITKPLIILYKARHFLNKKALYLILNSLLMSNVRYAANKKCVNDIKLLINTAIIFTNFYKYK